MYITLFLLKGLKSYKPSKYKCSHFLSKTHVTFLLWLITFEPLEQKQSYIPLLKVLMCGMNVWGAQWHHGIFILQYTSLNMVLLLHKTALVNFPMAITVHPWWYSFLWVVSWKGCINIALPQVTKNTTEPWHFHPLKDV